MQLAQALSTDTSDNGVCRYPYISTCASYTRQDMKKRFSLYEIGTCTIPLFYGIPSYGSLMLVPSSRVLGVETRFSINFFT